MVYLLIVLLQCDSASIPKSALSSKGLVPPRIVPRSISSLGTLETPQFRKPSNLYLPSSRGGMRNRSLHSHGRPPARQPLRVYCVMVLPPTHEQQRLIPVSEEQ